ATGERRLRLHARNRELGGQRVAEENVRADSVAELAVEINVERLIGRRRVESPAAVRVDVDGECGEIECAVCGKCGDGEDEDENDCKANRFHVVKTSGRRR